MGTENFRSEIQSISFGRSSRDHADYAWSLEDLPKDIDWISDLKFTVGDVRKIIKKISSTASGPSGISPLLLKNTEQTMAPIIWRWCRTVLDTEKLPSINILSIINPLLKPGKSAGDPASYRPVALTELLVRVLEKLLHNVMERHAEKHGLFSEEQHGFRKRRSTISNILRCQQKILEERGRGKTVDTIFLDLSKAFDKVPTKMLVKRLKNCGYRGKILSFCRNFLEGRRQYVIANGRCSDEKPVTSGTPQGGCLSPLFFGIYISPIVALLNTYSKNESMKQEKKKEKEKSRTWTTLFADDSKLSGSIQKEEDIQGLQGYLDISLECLSSRGMLVNSDKSYIVRSGPLKQNKTYYAGKDPIKFASSMRDLGLQYCQDGSYREQIEIAKMKAVRKANWVLRVFRNRSLDFFQTVWKSLVRPHLDYGSPVWAPTYQKDITKIEDVLRNFSRRCPAISNLHYWDRLRALKLSSCERRIERYIILYTFKILKGEVDDPGAFTTRYTIKRGTLLKSTLKMRGTEGLKTVIAGSFGTKAVQLYNSLPRFVREYDGPSSSFKQHLQIYLSEVPDMPREKSGLNLPQAVIPGSGVRSNSLIHWRKYLEKVWLDYPWNSRK